MRHRTRLNDIKKRKKRAGLSLLAKKRIIGISTMILAGLLMAVPFFSRALDTSNLDPLRDDTNAVVEYDCGAEGTGNNVKASLWLPAGESTPNKNLTLYINGTGAMRNYVLNNGVVDGRPWESYMEHITSVVIGETITHVGDYAFAPADVLDETARTEITSIAFEDRSSAYTGQNDRYLMIGEGAFAGSKITSLLLPPAMSYISRDAFARSSELMRVQFNVINLNGSYVSYLRGIGPNAFADCIKLAEIRTIEGQEHRTFPSSVEEIREGAFYNNKSLTSVTIPGGVIVIGPPSDAGVDEAAIHGAFEDCEKLKTVNFYTTSANESSLRTIGVRSFKGTALEGTLNLPAKPADPSIDPQYASWLTTIGEEAFYGLDKLTGKLTIPSTVTEIGARAFWGCSGLSDELKLPEGLTEIKGGTFGNCSGLTGTLTIPGGVKTIGAEAFHGCDGVTGVTFTGVPDTIGQRAFKQSTGNNAPEIYFMATSGVPVTATAANEDGRSFDQDDIILYPENNAEFEAALTDASDGTKRWKEYRVMKVNASRDPVYPAFRPMVASGVTEPKVFTAVPVSTVPTVFLNEGRGFRLIISPFTETTDPVRTSLDAGTSKPSENAIYVPYDISLYNYRSFFDGSRNPEPIKITTYVGEIKITMSLPTEIVSAIARDEAAEKLDALPDRLSLYKEDSTPNAASPITKIDFTDEGADTNGNRLISFSATQFSEFSLVYEPYVEKAFYVVDLRDDQHGDGKSRLFRGTGEGAPKRETFDVIYGTSEADAEPQNKATNPMNGYFLEIRPDEGEDIREAAWRDDGKGLQLAEKDWLLAPCDIRLFYDDGTGTEDAITEKKTDFGTINIQLPIPPEMTETDRIELLTLSYEGKLERGTERNGAFRVATRTDGNASQLFAYFEATHFSEYALYYVLDSAASDTSTTASTSSTEATTATGATTSSAAGGTTATGAATSDAAAAGSTATGANTASTATTATTSSTLASGASVAASTGGSGATNRAGATTPVAVTTGSSGSASGSDMPTTGDSDFYRMTLSMALMLFGAYELISTIRIRKKGNR